MYAEHALCTADAEDVGEICAAGAHDFGVAADGFVLCQTTVMVLLQTTVLLPKTTFVLLQTTWMLLQMCLCCCRRLSCC